MIKVFIADDEPMIRQGIRQSIDWENNDMEVVGDADNGKDALELVLLTKPDILICDIRMPQMNGIALSQEIIKALPSIRIIFITGYNNVDYLIDAIKLGVSDYLLKPAGRKKIASTIFKVIDDIINQVSSKQHKLDLEKFYSDNIYQVKSWAIYKFLNQDISPKQFQENNYIDFNSYVKFAIIVIYTNSNDIWDIITELHSVCQNSNLVIHIAESVNNQQIVIFLAYKHNVQYDQITRIFYHHANTPTKCKYLVIHSPETHQIHKLPEYFSNIEDRISKINVCRSFLVISYEELISLADVNVFDEIELLENRLSEISNTIDRNKSLQLINIYFQKIDMMHINIDLLSYLLYTFSIRLVMQYNAYNKNIDEEIRTLITGLCNDSTTVEQIRQEIIKLIDLSSKRQTSTFHAIKKYIEENADTDLSLEDVAQHTHISKGHICRIIKKETGTGFSDLLNYTRVSNAAKMLEMNNDIKYFYLAEKVGFKTYKQFSIYFKKYMGISASEYQSIYNAQ